MNESFELFADHKSERVEYPLQKRHLKYACPVGESLEAPGRTP